MRVTFLGTAGPGRRRSAPRARSRSTSSGSSSSSTAGRARSGSSSTRPPRSCACDGYSSPTSTATTSSVSPGSSRACASTIGRSRSTSTAPRTRRRWSPARSRWGTSLSGSRSRCTRSRRESRWSSTATRSAPRTPNIPSPRSPTGSTKAPKRGPLRCRAGDARSASTVRTSARLEAGESVHVGDRVVHPSDVMGDLAGRPFDRATPATPDRRTTSGGSRIERRSSSTRRRSRQEIEAEANQWGHSSARQAAELARSRRGEGALPDPLLVPLQGARTARERGAGRLPRLARGPRPPRRAGPPAMIHADLRRHGRPRGRDARARADPADRRRDAGARASSTTRRSRSPDGRIAWVGPARRRSRSVRLAAGRDGRLGRGRAWSFPGSWMPTRTCCSPATERSSSRSRSPERATPRSPVAAGGLYSTVRATRAAPDAATRPDETAGRLRRMVANGATSVEVKSGYALDVAGRAAPPPT